MKLQRKPRKIFMGIESFSTGGVAKVACQLADKFSEEGHQVEFLCFKPPDPSKDSVTPKQMCHLLNDSRSGGTILSRFLMPFRLRGRLRELSTSGERPCFLIAHLPHMSFYLRIASLGLPLSFISFEHMHPAFEFVTRSPLHKLARALAYRLSDAVVVLTQSSKDYFSSALRGRCFVIPNFLDSAETNSTSDDLELFRPFVLGVGRLTRQKRFDKLIQCFLEATEGKTEWHLYILGDGPERMSLEALVLRVGLSNRVHLVGNVLNPRSYYERAEVFAMASDHEGFPMALLEALQGGLPVLYTDCPSGPGEIIEQNVSGLLAPAHDSNNFVTQLGNLVQCGKLRQRLGVQAKASVKRFSWQNVGAQWEDLLTKLERVRFSRFD